MTVVIIYRPSHQPNHTTSYSFHALSIAYNLSLAVCVYMRVFAYTWSLSSTTISACSRDTVSRLIRISQYSALHDIHTHNQRHLFVTISTALPTPDIVLQPVGGRGPRSNFVHTCAQDLRPAPGRWQIKHDTTERACAAAVLPHTFSTPPHSSPICSSIGHTCRRGSGARQAESAASDCRPF